MLTAADIQKRELALLRAAEKLATRSAQEWHEFIAALASHSEISSIRLLRSGPEDIHRAQGQAQAIIGMVEMLGEHRERLKALTAPKPPQAQPFKPLKKV